MAKSFELYIKTDCEFCRKAVDLLTLKKLPFVAVVMDRDPEYMDRIKKLYSWPTVPIVLKTDGETRDLVGGFTDLEESLSGEANDG